ncbi:MAG: hypothetical protein JWN34_2035 [Bryobacterales bacterium]|nr:hypothetical protein [Bryobacterales bacterium]
MTLTGGKLRLLFSIETDIFAESSYPIVKAWPMKSITSFPSQNGQI